MRSSKTFRGIVTLCLMTLTGCQVFDMGPIGLGNDLPKATPANPVREIVCLWEPAEGVGLDGLPTRGFAGQILFSTLTSAQPVQAVGNVRIYVFDNLGTPEEQARPIHQFDFPSEVWNTFLHDTNLGAAYQVFIPYTRKGGYAAACVLRVRLTPENGLPVYSKMSTIHLPGRSAPHDSGAQAEAGVAQAVNADSGTADVSGIADLAMPIDAIDVTSRQPASVSLQRSVRPNTSGLNAAIAELLRDVETDDDNAAMPEEPEPVRHNLSARRSSGSQ